MVSKLKILIIDDSSIGRIAVKQALRQAEFELAELESAEPFFRYPNQYKDVDLVIIDISLPGMDGLTALEKIRAEEQWPNLPVIVLTSRSDPESVGRALRAHANDYIVKPFSGKVLLSKVHRTLEYKRQNWPDREMVLQTSNEIKRAERGGTSLSALGVRMLNPRDHLSNPWDIHNLREQLRMRLREIDTVYCNGRDILVLLPFTDGSGAEIVAQKIREILFPEIKMIIAAYPAHGRNAQQLLYNLKQKLYPAE